MFNLSKQVSKLQQLNHDKVHGLPYKRKPKNLKVQHIDSEARRRSLGEMFELDAICEGKAIPRGFHNHSLDFGRRLSKVKGQKHHPGGGYALHTERG